MKEAKKIIIVGAGIAGKLLKNDIEKNYPEHEIIGFIDDREKNKSESVLGGIDDLPKINDLFQVDEIVIAIPSASGEQIRKILLKNIDNTIPVRIVPRSQRIIRQDDVKYSEVKDLDAEDFLGRPFLKKNVETLKKFYKNKTVLITGGAGSIGSEIVRQLIDLDVKKVIVFDNSEYLTFNLDQDLKERGISAKKYRLVIGSILNLKKLDNLIKKEKPDIIFHAAAYKHVYLMEENIDEAVMNNIVGTKNVVDTAIKNRVRNFIFISTDKVVNPTSVMGATKKIAEYYIKGLGRSHTKFNVVRFGNVINSHGSVLPLFERQIRDHKYVTVTHKKVRRFFMSIREAAQLVINSAARDNRGEIFILDMGELINIYEVALCLVRSKNLLPQKDVEIRIIGLKKGEKIIEELFTEKEKKNLIKTDIDNVFRLKNFESCSSDIGHVMKDLKELISADKNFSKTRSYLKKLFPSLLRK
ncbi:MAG: polysaccharide biosynthesis protein [Candidatus Moranbacteria bacterium]|nr:polysaccharide biosynthesis protein [Candidatus Moranbacteria bacterium]